MVCSGDGNSSAPVVWFVSHCKDYNGRMKYVRWLQQSIGEATYLLNYIVYFTELTVSCRCGYIRFMWNSFVWSGKESNISNTPQPKNKQHHKLTSHHPPPTDY